MKIRIVCIGKIKEKYFNLGIDEYLKRLKPYAKVEIVELAETKINDNPSQAQIDQVINEEGEKLLKALNKNDYNIALDLHGRELNNEELVRLFEDKQLRGYSTFTFIIGGSYGISQEVIDFVEYRWCLSKLTFTHQMIRMILLEQIYRTFKIMKNEPYHK